MNVFLNDAIAREYDAYYQTPMGKAIDKIEKETLAAFLKNEPKGKLLELGCGTGHWSEFLSNLGFEVQASDISDAMLNIARKKNLPNITFQKADASFLPFADNSFNLVVSVTMLEFVQDQTAVLKEIYRILSPNGLLVLSCLNLNSVLGKTKDQSDTFREAKFYTKDSIHEALTMFGVPQIVECVYLNSNFELIDPAQARDKFEGVFLSVAVRKSKI